MRDYCSCCSASLALVARSFVAAPFARSSLACESGKKRPPQAKNSQKQSPIARLSALCPNLRRSNKDALNANAFRMQMFRLRFYFGCFVARLSLAGARTCRSETQIELRVARQTNKPSNVCVAVRAALEAASTLACLLLGE